MFGSPKALRTTSRLLPGYCSWRRTLTHGYGKYPLFHHGTKISASEYRGFQRLLFRSPSLWRGLSSSSSLRAGGKPSSSPPEGGGPHGPNGPEGPEDRTMALIKTLVGFLVMPFMILLLLSDRDSNDRGSDNTANLVPNPYRLTWNEFYNNMLLKGRGSHWIFFSLVTNPRPASFQVGQEFFDLLYIF